MSLVLHGKYCPQTFNCVHRVLLVLSTTHGRPAPMACRQLPLLLVATLPVPTLPSCSCCPRPRGGLGPWPAPDETLPR